MSNKANLLAECVRDTWLDSNLPCVSAVCVAANVTMYIRETTVSEEREVTSLCESVTEVWVQHECVCIVISNRHFNASQVVTVLAMRITNLHGYVKLVIEFVTNLRKKIEVVRLANLNLVYSSSLMAVTNFTTNPNLCVCCKRCYCYESCK